MHVKICRYLPLNIHHYYERAFVNFRMAYDLFFIIQVLAKQLICAQLLVVGVKS